VGILENVWSEGASLRLGQELPPLAKMLDRLVSPGVVALTLPKHSPTSIPFAVTAGTEVLPGASLADVLYEEFSTEVEPDTIVLFLPDQGECGATSRSDEMGYLLGTILVQLSRLDRSVNQAGGAAREAPLWPDHVTPPKREVGTAGQQ
jgi:hypothetical protein